MIKYRIKTKEEFIDEFGEDWRNDNGICRNGYYFNPDMDYLFGFELSNYKNKDYTRIPGTEWVITKDMIKEVRIGVDYNEKKVLVYD